MDLMRPAVRGSQSAYAAKTAKPEKFIKDHSSTSEQVVRTITLLGDKMLSSSGGGIKG